MEKLKSYINTTIDADLLKKLKMAAVQECLRMNQLLEQAIKDLLNKKG